MAPVSKETKHEGSNEEASPSAGKEVPSLSVICHDSVLSEGHKKCFKGTWLILSRLTFFILPNFLIQWNDYIIKIM